MTCRQGPHRLSSGEPSILGPELGLKGRNSGQSNHTRRFLSIDRATGLSVSKRVSIEEYGSELSADSSGEVEKSKNVGDDQKWFEAMMHQLSPVKVPDFQFENLRISTFINFIILHGRSTSASW